MKIDIIDNFESFQAIRNNWDSVYEVDPQARFFSSWIWLSGMLKRYDEYHENWFILAAKSSTHAPEYVAFFPLKIAIGERKGGELYNVLFIAGVTDSECIGFICLPEYEEEVTSAFAIYLQQQEEWSIFKMQNIQQTDKRLSLFLRNFSRESFEIKELHHTNDNLDRIDNNIVPYIPLPDNWDRYLQNVLSSNTRQKIRRYLRKIEDSNEFSITHVSSDNLERHIEILLGFWKLSWEGRKGPDRCRMILDSTSFTLRHCFENNCLYLSVLWKGDKPLGAIANLMDFSQKTILFYIGGRDDTVTDPPSGIILHALGIQYAIQNGFKIYDFLMGNEAYKFSFGAKERHIKIVEIQRKNLESQSRKLDVRTIPIALEISANHSRANRLVEAEQAYRQILNVQPKHPDALYGLGVVMQQMEEYQTAENLLRKLLEVQPDNTKAWFSLGTLNLIQGLLSEAEQAYQQALTLQPESSTISLAVYHNLGYTLQQQGKWEQAIACYQKARELQPDSIEAEVIWANALYAQGTLSSEKQAHYAAMNHNLGNMRKQVGDLKVAIEYFRQAIKMNSYLVEAHYHLGLALQEQGKWEEAIACYQKARELQPDSLEIEVSLANALHAQRKLSSEEKARYAVMNLDLGNKSRQEGDLKIAIVYYRQAIEMNPDLVDAHFNLGLVLQEQGKWEEAIACYQKAREFQPDSLEIEVGLANALHAQRKLSSEEKARYAVMNLDLGNKRRQEGDLKIASEHYWQAIEMNPDLVDARDNLRLALQEQNNVKIKVSCAKR
ncbi:MAG: GNAT family N-acetyltransferase [Pseudanabaena sp. SU_2_4]|nr:GNAT family N-acetyltransferase [Pseudanabaena sp. SU_2_4]